MKLRDGMGCGFGAVAVSTVVSDCLGVSRLGGEKGVETLVET